MISQKIGGEVESHRLRCDLPAFRRAATPPWRFMPREVGRAAMPFDARHCSRLELRGPCVDIRFELEAEDPAPSSSIASVRCMEVTKHRGGFHH